MNLRPHHLICIQNYIGKGYSDKFIKQMDYITSLLKASENITVTLTFKTDDICKSCPNMQGEDLCNSNEKVKNIDYKMITYFNLEEKEYNYINLLTYIKNKITPEILNDICKDCEWYSIGECKNFFNKPHENK